MSSLATVVIALVVAWFGYLPFQSAAIYAGMIVVFIAAFYAMIASGWSVRFADPGLTVPQLVVAGLVTTYVVFEGHASRPTFMFFYLCAFMFGVFLLNPRKLLGLGLFYLACYAVAAGFSLVLQPEATNPQREMFRLVILAATLAWLIGLGKYIDSLRASLGMATSEVARLGREQRLVFDTATVGIVHLRDRLIVDCNAHFVAMFGYAREELIGKSTRMLYVDESGWEKMGDTGYAALANGEAVRREVAMRTRNGSVITCDFATACLFAGQPDRGVVAILNDVTAARRQQADLRQALLEQLAIFKNAPAGIVFIRHRVVEDCNDMLVKIFGYTLEEWVGQSTRRVFLSDEDWERLGILQLEAFSRGDSYAYEAEFVRKDGQKIWCRVRGGAIDPEQGAEGPVVYVIVDITDRKRAEAALRQNREQLVQVIRASQSGIWDYDMVTGDIQFSGRFYQILGLPTNTDPLSIMPMTERVHPADARLVLDAFKAHLRNHAQLDVEFRLRRSDDSYTWVRGFGQATWNERGRAVRLVGSILDISDRKLKEEEIHRLALHDPLTGLPNRRLLEDRLEKALDTARRNGTQVSVMLLDLDRFKKVNDEYGHEAGDMVLRAAAERLSACVRGADTVARTGGDEFVVLMEAQRQPSDAVSLAEKMLACLSEPLNAGDYCFTISASIGIAVYPLDSEQPAQLIRMADKAMYGVKESGRNGYRFHSVQGGRSENSRA